MARCKWKKNKINFLDMDNQCREEVPLEGANYCLKHGCNYICAFRNPATQKTSFGKNVCDKCFDAAEIEYKRTQEEKKESIKTKRLEDLQNWCNETMVAIKNASADFWRDLEKGFEEVSNWKKSLVERVKKWEEREKNTFSIIKFHIIDEFFPLLTIEEKREWKKIYEKNIPSYDEFSDFLDEEKNLLVNLAQQRKLKNNNIERERERESKKQITSDYSGYRNWISQSSAGEDYWTRPSIS